MKPEKKIDLRQKRRWRIRKQLIGTVARPRMSVRFTGRNIYVQFIDDATGHTLAAASTQHKTMPDREKLASNFNSAQAVGRAAAEAAKSKGISTVIFDRSGARYHGKVKALAVSSTKRSPVLPNAPTFMEVGWGDYPGQGWWGLAAPKGTPKPIVDQLSTEFAKLFSDPKFTAFLEKQAVISAPTTPEDFATFVRDDRKSAEALIKLANTPREDYAPPK